MKIYSRAGPEVLLPLVRLFSFLQVNNASINNGMNEEI